MKKDYSIEMCKTLENEYNGLGLLRPLAVKRYDVGDIVEYEATAVAPDAHDKTSRIRIQIQQFVGGGFAGQVYKVKVLGIEPDTLPGLQIANSYALKILIPPSGGGAFFRNLLYWIGFQGPFQLQSNPAAAKAGALWQKFIRRGAKIRFGDESCVKDMYAIFVDTQLGSCGEITSWVEGRTWQLEVDDHMELLSRWKKGKLFLLNASALRNTERRSNSWRTSSDCSTTWALMNSRASMNGPPARVNRTVLSWIQPMTILIPVL